MHSTKHGLQQDNKNVPREQQVTLGAFGAGIKVESSPLFRADGDAGGCSVRKVGLALLILAFRRGLAIVIRVTGLMVYSRTLLTTRLNSRMLLSCNGLPWYLLSGLSCGWCVWHNHSKSFRSCVAADSCGPGWHE